MIRIDERARGLEVGDDQRRALARALDVDGVVAAMLSGSHARGSAGPISDVDVAVWLRPELDARARLRLRLRLARAASVALGGAEVDLVVLNDAPLLVAHRLQADAVGLVERDRGLRVRLAARSLLDYLDTAPLRAELARGLHHRVTEDRFGRR